MSEKLYMFDLDRFQVDNYAKIGNQSYYNERKQDIKGAFLGSCICL